MHTADLLRGTKSTLLSGKRVVLGVTGSIAAVETVKLARELIRHGADVQAVMTHAATTLVGADALEFATGKPVITRLTGQVEHVAAADKVNGADLILVAPATANTIAKIAHGIDDSPVTTFVSTCLGVKPVAVAPAMHETMHENPVHQDNLRRLSELGVHVVPPLFEEGKAKLAGHEVIVEHVVRILGPRTLADRKVLVIAGPTEERVDAMRVLSNRSSGGMGHALSLEAFRLGAEVTRWLSARVHDHVAHLGPAERFRTVDDLLALAERAGEFDVVLMPAAISDYAPRAAEGKIPSGKEKLAIDLTPLPKVIETVRKRCHGTLVAFKAESGVDDAELEKRGRAAMERTGSDLVAANRLEEVDADTTRILLVARTGTTALHGAKTSVARSILEAAAAVGGKRG